MHDPGEKKPGQAGKVHLVGAGPGDPGLLTLRGKACLEMADVIVYDALSAASLLDLAPAAAERIDAGKRAGDHKLSQDEINALLAAKAGEGRCVVRLKGGDPYLFGRGAEEVAFLASRGIECEVVPGVTAGIAAPAYAGIPVTHRGIASTVTFVTGHEQPDKPDSGVDFEALAGLAKAGGTLCFYMGVGRLARIAARLQSHGLDASTPAALVQWGATPRQRSLRSTVGNLAMHAEKAGLGAPGIIVVGQAAGIDEPGLNFFERRPLFGQRILVTRTRQQASDLRVQLESLGAEVIEAPTIEIVPPLPEDAAKVDEAIRGIGDYDWLVLTSANGVAALRERLEALGLDARHLAGLKIACIGQATAGALREQLGVRADLVPDEYVAESLAEEMVSAIAAQREFGARIIFLRADIARTVLCEALRKAGAAVEDLPVYRTTMPAALPGEAQRALDAGEVDWVTFTSSSTVRNLAALLGGDAGRLLSRCRLASIGPITSRAMREMGFEPEVEASPSTVESLAAAVVAAGEVHPFGGPEEGRSDV